MCADMEDEEKKELLVNDEPANNFTGSSPPSYGAAAASEEEAESSPQPVMKDSGFMYRHRDKIPGYGVYRMVRGVKPYAHWVLLMMLLVYLINQLDRYTLPIVVTEVGYDLHYGNEVCMVNRELNQTLMDAAINITKRCTADNQSSHYDNLIIK